MIDPDKFAWSFSQWETYNACPRRWKFQSVDRLPRTPPGPAAARGLLIHKTVEDYICWKPGAELHPAVKPEYIPVINEFRDHPNGERHVELKIGLTKDWNLTGNIVGERTWCRAVLDAARVGTAWPVGQNASEPQIAHIGEWKSGKPKDTHGDQRNLYAAAALLKWPWVDEVQVTTHYLEGTGPSQRLRALPSSLPKLKEKWMMRSEEMRTDEFCAPRPGYHCNWCDFAKGKGGPCDFGA